MRGHGIEFVIVTAGALQRVRKKGLTHAVCHIVEEALPRDLFDLHTGQLPWPHAEEARGDDLFWIIWVDLIPRDLLPDKLVIGLVTVERSHHIISIAPGIPTFVVVREA